MPVKTPRIEVTMEELNAEYGDWKEVFKYAEGFDRADVVGIIAAVNGERDEADWLGVFKLKDRRIGVIRAGCDYTGWGCQEGGSSEIHASMKAALSPLGIPRDERERLGL